MKVLLIILLFAGASLELSFNGTCPSNYDCYDSKLKLSLSDLLGTWYLQAIIPSPYDLNQKCSFVKRYPTFNPNEMIGIRTDINNVTLKKREAFGKFTLEAPNHSHAIFTELKLAIPFKFLEVEKDWYTTIACVECGFFIQGKYIAYGVTRERFPSQEIKDKIVASFEKCGVSREELLWIDQNNCNFCDET